MLLAFLMAIAVAGTLTYVLVRRSRANAAEQSRMIHIVAAARDLASGVTLTPKDVMLVDWPGEVALPGSFSKVEDVVDHPVLYSLKAKEPVLERELAIKGSGSGLSAMIPPGMRATAVRSNEIVGVAGFLNPGSHVDVLATYSQQGGSGYVTQTILQNVEVLTAGQTIEPDPQGKPQAVNVVTLVLTPEDSQKLQLTSTQGTLQFVLRNGTDEKTADIKPARLDQLIPAAQSAVPPAMAKNGPKRAAAPPPPVYTLEVIQGTVRKEQKF